MEEISGHIELEATVMIFTIVSCIYIKINVNNPIIFNPEHTAALFLFQDYYFLQNIPEYDCIIRSSVHIKMDAVFGGHVCLSACL